LVRESHGEGAVADRARDPLRGLRSNVAGDEDARPNRLEQLGLARGVAEAALARGGPAEHEAPHCLARPPGCATWRSPWSATWPLTSGADQDRLQLRSALADYHAAAVPALLDLLGQTARRLRSGGCVTFRRIYGRFVANPPLPRLLPPRRSRLGSARV